MLGGDCTVGIGTVAGHVAGGPDRPRVDLLLIHFDVDVVDFTDTPLSENAGRNEGLPYRDAMRALEALLESPRLGGLTITELNPGHAEEGSKSIEQLSRDIARGLAPG